MPDVSSFPLFVNSIKVGQSKCQQSLSDTHDILILGKRIPLFRNYIFNIKGDPPGGEGEIFLKQYMLLKIIVAKTVSLKNTGRPFLQTVCGLRSLAKEDTNAGVSVWLKCTNTHSSISP